MFAVCHRMHMNKVYGYMLFVVGYCMHLDACLYAALFKGLWLDRVVVKMMDCQLRGHGSNPAKAKIIFKISASPTILSQLRMRW